MRVHNRFGGNREFQLRAGGGFRAFEGRDARIVRGNGKRDYNYLRTGLLLISAASGFSRKEGRDGGITWKKRAV